MRVGHVSHGRDGAVYAEVHDAVHRHRHRVLGQDLRGERREREAAVAVVDKPCQWLRSGLPPVAGCQRTRSLDQLSQSCLCKAEQRKGLAGSKELALDPNVHSTKY